MLVCAWMGTGGVLHHTEAEGTARAARTQATARLRHAAVVPSDACAACEWTQGLQSRTLSVCQIDFPLLLLSSRQADALFLLTAQTFRHRSSRAPPISFAFC